MDNAELLEKLRQGAMNFFRRERLLHDVITMGDRYMLRSGFVGVSPHYGEFKMEVYLEGVAVQTYVYFPETVSGEHLGAIAEFIARANGIFKMGHFGLNYQRGMLAFHLGQRGDMAAAQNNEAWRDQVYMPVAMMARYAEGFYRIIHEGMSPIDALSLCDRQNN